MTHSPLAPTPTVGSTPAPANSAPHGARNGVAQVNRALQHFLSVRQGARRFHKDVIGDYDPAHCLGDFLCKVAARDHAGIRQSYGASLDYTHSALLDNTGCRSKAALAESSGIVGGYLVPLELSLELMGDVAEFAFIRPLATVVSMQSATQQLPLLDATTTTGTTGVPTFFGGIQMKFLSEAQARGESEPKFRNVELKATDLSGIAYVSNPMMQDSYGLEKWLRHLFASSIAWFEDYYFLRGTGVGQPVGVLNAGALIKQARNTSSQVKQVDLANMDLELLPYSFNHAMWLVSVSAIGQIRQVTGYIPNSTIESDWQGTRADGLLYNRPVYVSEKSPVLGTLGDVLLFDPSLYVIGDRGALEIDISAQYPTTWANYQTAWRILERVDGQPALNASITLQDQATVVSPYVALNA